jgi:hypothetical protein
MLLVGVFRALVLPGMRSWAEHQLTPNPPGLSLWTGNAGGCDSTRVSGLDLRQIGTAICGMHGERPKESGGNDCALSPLTELAV